MHKIKDIVKQEIDDIVAKPLSVKAVEVLGELIDIYKDIEYIDYMHCKESHMKWEEMHSDEYGVAHDDAMDKIKNSIVAYKKAKEDFNKKNDAITKNAMINALQELMDSYNYAIHGTWDGTDTNEERALIKEYTSKRFSGSLT